MHAPALSACARAPIGVKAAKSGGRSFSKSPTAISTRWRSAPQPKQNHSEAVLLTCPAGVFDNEPDRARDRALRRVAQMWGQQKDLPFSDRHVIDPARFGELQDYVAA